MKELDKSVDKTLRLYKYSSIIFIIIYWVYIIIDDYNFIVNYWNTNWIDYIKIWSIYFLIYFVLFTIIFCSISLIILFCYYKIHKRFKQKNKLTE